MSLKKFNGHQDMRIDKVKAHAMYLRATKEKFDNTAALTVSDEDHHDKQPWELNKVKNLCKGKPKPKLEKEDLFDITNDGKPMKKKKETKKEKDTRAFIMCDGKKYHEIGGKTGF
tara:strand:+ start:6008 stop:6352 length:345 start_codon:yes stop_codon:yes gene_type:complete